MRNKYRIPLIPQVICLLLLIACDTKVVTGPSINAGPISISLTINTSGEIVLSGGYSHTLVGTQDLGVGWDIGFETTLADAWEREHHLFIIYEDAQGRIWQQQYEIGQPFSIKFTRDEWVSSFEHLSNGSWIISVEPNVVVVNNLISEPPHPTIAPAPTTATTPAPRPTPKPATCDYAAGPTFSGFLQLHPSLGCPINNEDGDTVAYAPFEHGFMLWRASTDLVYVVYGDGTWAQFSDTWTDGQDPTYSCADASTPSTTPPTPQRGFGKVWCTQSGVRAKLGNALSGEIGNARARQDFENGMMVYIHELNAVYAFDRRLMQWASSR